jgi:hypothetical protein
MDDLTALDKQGAWEELSQHLGDIPPSKRDGRWNEMLEHASTGVLVNSGKTDHSNALAVAEDLLRSFPQLKKSQAFMHKRNELGLKGFESCFGWAGGIADCNQRLSAFLDADPGNHALAVAAAKMAMLHQTPYGTVVLWKQAVAGRKDAPECGEEGLGRAVLGALGLPPTYTNAKEAKDLAANLCRGKLQPLMVAEFNRGGRNGYYTKNACEILKPAGVLSRLQASFCEPEEAAKPVATAAKSVRRDPPPRRATQSNGKPIDPDVLAKQRRYDLELLESMDRLNAKCGTDMQATIDWSSFEKAEWDGFSVSSYCENAISSMMALCKERVGREVVASGVKQYNCRYGGEGKRAMALKSGTLEMLLDFKAANYDQYTHEFLMGHL